MAAARRELADGADAQAVDNQGFTPLHFAAQGNAGDVASLLLAHGAAVDATDQWGDTPLWRAVFNYRGDPSMILLLRRAGANVDLTNKSGASPRSLARLIANYDVAKWVVGELPPPD